MCLIIHSPEGKTDSDLVARAAKSNPDGFGIVYLDDPKMSHLTMDYEVASGALETGRPYVAHFRFATVGKVAESNCHPFPIGKTGSWLFMNGTVEGLGSEEEADTRHLARILGELPRELWADVASMTDCRFAFVDPSGEVELLGEWHDKGGCAYSNKRSFYAPFQPKKYTGGYPSSSYRMSDKWEKTKSGGYVRKTEPEPVEQASSYRMSDKWEKTKSGGYVRKTEPEPVEQAATISEAEWIGEGDHWANGASMSDLECFFCAGHGCQSCAFTGWELAPENKQEDALMNWHGNNLVAVYGTLKQGGGNHHLLAGARAEYLGKGKTRDPYWMAGRGCPMVYASGPAGSEFKVPVQVYDVPELSVRAGLDRLEGHPTNYMRHETSIIMKGGEVRAWVYFVSGHASSRYLIKGWHPTKGAIK